MARIDRVIQIKLNQLVQENVHMSTALQSKRIYRCHSDKHFSQFLPTRWRRLSTGIDKEQNYATVTLCIQRSDQYFCCSPVRVLLLHYTRLMALFPGLPR